jgi:ribosomal protein S8
MSQDIISDTLNQIMNAKKAGKKEIVVTRYSRLLLKILDLAKENGYLSYEIEGKTLKIIIENLNEIKSIKPRYSVQVKQIDKYVRRFLPAKNFGFVIISTNKGLMKTKEAEEQNLGGCLVAYLF